MSQACDKVSSQGGAQMTGSEFTQGGLPIIIFIGAGLLFCYFIDRTMMTEFIRFSITPSLQIQWGENYGIHSYFLS